MENIHLSLAKAYYQAMGEKNTSEMAKYLDPKVHFVGPLADIKGKEAVLDGVKMLLPFFEKLTIRAIFGSNDQVMMAYDLKCAVPIGTFRVAALLTFKNNLITQIELFFDARPFDKMPQNFFKST